MFLHSLSLKQRFAFLVTTMAIGIVILSGIFYKALEEVKVNGPIYGRIIMEKDLVADILPPPEYILESYLVVLQISRAKSDKIPALVDRLKVLHKEFDDRHAYWEQQPLKEQTRKLLLEDSAKHAQQFYNEAETSFIPSALSGDHEGMMQSLEKIESSYSKHREAIDETVKFVNQQLVLAEEEAKTTVSTDHKIVLAVFLLTLIACIAIASMVANSVLIKLGGEPTSAADVAARIAKGDLSGKIEIHSQDPSCLMASLAAMQQQLRAMIAELRDNSQVLFQSSGELASTMHSLADAGRAQATSATSMAASVEEMTVSISHISERASEVHQMSEDAGKKSSESGRVVQQSANEMHRISESVTESANKISALESAAAEISVIINVIREIAEQTNLLALNAAIEAARAGEQGRGFAVVADEVRKLAERTGQSTQEISGMVENIQSITRDAVSGMSESVEQVNQSAGLAQQTGQSITDIQEAAQQVLTAANDMAAALNQQSSASQDIARNVETIAQMTESSSAAMAQASTLAETLEQRAQLLDEMVGRFKLA